jgi:hypothetical protein
MHRTAEASRASKLGMPSSPQATLAIEQARQRARRLRDQGKAPLARLAQGEEPGLRRGEAGG